MLAIVRKSCRVLLINANRCAHPDPVFPLGLSYIAAGLREAGHDCIWLDSLADQALFPEKLRASRADYAGISLRNIDDVLIRRKETFFEDAADLVALVRKELRCPVIIGGSGFSIFPEQLLERTGADFGISGEAERSFAELIGALESGADFRRIPGLVYRDNGRTCSNAPGRRLAPLLNENDCPADTAAHYLKTGSMLNVQTQRGCGFRCCYCTYPVIEGRQHRRQNSEAVAAEFERLARRGASYVFVVDSVFNSSPQHVIETCEALIRSGNKLRWGCFLRPQGLTREQMDLLARAGLAHIEFGTDSFCNEVLSAYHKDFTFDDIVGASELASNAKIDFCHFLISGGPGETYETLDQGFRNSGRLKGAVIMAVVGMRIYPGTELCRRALAEGRISQETDLLKPVYYLSENLTEAGVFARLREYARESPSWIPGDPAPGYERMVDRLRQRGVAGPLWSYFAMMQRLWPQANRETVTPK